MFCSAPVAASELASSDRTLVAPLLTALACSRLPCALTVALSTSVACSVDGLPTLASRPTCTSTRADEPGSTGLSTSEAVTVPSPDCAFCRLKAASVTSVVVVPVLVAEAMPRPSRADETTATSLPDALTVLAARLP